MPSVRHKHVLGKDTQYIEILNMTDKRFQVKFLGMLSKNFTAHTGRNVLCLCDSKIQILVKMFVTIQVVTKREDTGRIKFVKLDSLNPYVEYFLIEHVNMYEPRSVSLTQVTNGEICYDLREITFLHPRARIYMPEPDGHVYVRDLCAGHCDVADLDRAWINA
jgi:hypothetical protein